MRVWLTEMAEIGAPGSPAKFKVNRAQLMLGWLTEMAEIGAPGPPAKLKVNRAQLMVRFGWIR